MQTDLRTDAAMRRRRTIRWAFALAGVTSLAAAAPAFASKATVDYGAGTVLFQAAGGEANDLQIAPFATTGFSIDDLSHTPIALDQIAAASPCTVMEPFKFRCGLTGLSRFEVDLGDGADSLAYSLAVPVTVSAGAGAKTITTGAGDDAIDVRNGAADSVDCGAGNDLVLADPIDTVAADCESVNPADPNVTLPVVGTGDASAGGGATAGTGDVTSPIGITLRSLTLQVARSMRAIVPLSCAADAVDGCHGEVVLTLPPRHSKGSSRRVIAARGHFTQQVRRRGRRLGRCGFKLAAGASVKLPVRIALRGHFALASRRRSRAKVLLQVLQRDAAGKLQSVQTRTVTLVLHRKRGRR